MLYGEMTMVERDLEKEIELMLKLVPGDWRLRFGKSNYATLSITVKCEIVDSLSRVAVTGFGGSNKAALYDLFNRWKDGWTIMPFPMPAGSREELELKLAVFGKGEAA